MRVESSMSTVKYPFQAVSQEQAERTVIWILVKIVRGAAGQFLLPQRYHLARLHEHDVVRALHAPANEQETFFGDYQAKPFEECGRNDGVGHARFVFQAD